MMVNRARPAFYRLTTTVERTLFAAIGLSVPADAECLVQLVTASIPRRSWPSAVPTTREDAA
jgi:hypothetical protein